MLITDPSAALRFARQRARDLREQIAAPRIDRVAATHCPLAALLRWATGRRSPATLADGAV